MDDKGRMPIWDRTMNGIKNVALLLVVVGIGYLVYQHLYGPGPSPGPETAHGPEVPKLEIPGWNRSGVSKSESSAEASGMSRATATSVQPTSRFVPASGPGAGSVLPDPDQKRTTANVSAKGPPAKPEANPSGGSSGSGGSSAPPAKCASPGAEGKNSSGQSSSMVRSENPSGNASSAGPAPETTSGNSSGNVRPANEIGEQFILCMQVAAQLLQQGQWTEVLAQLSMYYRHPELTQAESEKLTELLDRLAGSVIYSREHRLEPPYRVRPGDNLVQIARQYQVSWELLAKINGIPDPYRLEGVEVLKVLRGPFHALVDLTRREITLMLEFRDSKGQIHPLYAGRFPIRAISGVSELEGQYEVLRKAPGPRAQQPGPLALELTQQVILHGPADAQVLPKSHASLELPETDMEDVYDILTIGSRVLIRK